MTLPYKIDANSRNIKELLTSKYTIDYYQREYRWGTKQIEELINDMAAKFLQYYEESHSRDDGEKYGHYFLGSIVLSKKNNQTFIVDGQQRLTSLTLLMIYLNNLHGDNLLDEFIFSEVRGQKSFNLHVPERIDAINALYHGKEFDTTDKPESVQNIVNRYNDISELFPDELKGNTLIFFIDWILYNVDMVEIIAYSDEEAYTVFETMNDRGLSLNPTDMLKGYLLSKIKDEEHKDDSNKLWKKRILDLLEMGRDLDVKNEDVEACKAWLRAKHANSIREGRRGAINQDFERIGTAFHRWVRDESESLGLQESNDFRNFINDNFEKYTRLYLFMRRQSANYNPDYDHIYYNAHNNFTLQYILALAPIKLSDSQDIAERKIRMVTKFIDIFVARRMVNFRTLTYSSIVYTMFNLTKKIRDTNLTRLHQILLEELDEMPETFNAITDGSQRYNTAFYLHNQNKRHILYLLARITHYIERESGEDTYFPRYVNRNNQKGMKRFEIEHIWSSKYEQHADEFASEDDFQSYRNRFGGLILLPRGTNQSLGGSNYEQKMPHYIKENFLTKSLNEQFYERNPNFLRFRDDTGLGFQPHAEFKKADLDARQDLYQQICEHIWSPERLESELV